MTLNINVIIALLLNHIVISYWCSLVSFFFFNVFLYLLQAIDRFRANEHGILVATDVAARGLDIPGVRTVVHYQLPHSAEVSRTCDSFHQYFVIIFLFLTMSYILYWLGVCS